MARLGLGLAKQVRMLQSHHSTYDVYPRTKMTKDLTVWGPKWLRPLQTYWCKHNARTRHLCKTFT